MAEANNLLGNVNDPARSSTLLANVNEAPTPMLLANTKPAAAQPTTNKDPLAGMSQTARSLYVDPTPIYQGSLDFIGKQRNQANERYAQNKADIANIFGTLTQVNQESQNRVNTQFAQSITDQQLATAQRVAAARAGQQATQQSAIQAMDERGGGPVGNLAASPANVAAERGIADMNTYQQIFQGQQGAIQQQTQQDLQAALRGLGFQQTEATRGLQRSLEDTLLGLSGQEVGVRRDLAGAKIAGRQQVRQANYGEVMDQRAAEAAARLAAIQGAASTRNAEINAANKLRIAEINAANRVENYGSDSLGISRRLIDSGVEPESFWNTVDNIDLTGVTSASAAYSQWRKANPRAQMAAADAARDWFNSQRYEKADPNSLLPSANTGARR